MNSITDSFTKNGIVLVTGPGGSGKSTLAMKYADWYSRNIHDSTVVWFNANDADEISDHFREILIDDLRKNKDEVARMDLQQRIKRIIGHLLSDERTHLFIFDNIDETQMKAIEDISKSMPKNLKLLLTSRNRMLNKDFKLEMKQHFLSGVDDLQTKHYLTEKL